MVLFALIYNKGWITRINRFLICLLFCRTFHQQSTIWYLIVDHRLVCYLQVVVILTQYQPVEYEKIVQVHCRHVANTRNRRPAIVFAPIQNLLVRIHSFRTVIHRMFRHQIQHFDLLNAKHEFLNVCGSWYRSYQLIETPIK